MSFRTSCKLLSVCTILLCAAAAMAQNPTTIFQLDGNSADDFLTCVYSVGTPPNPGTECDYWNLINQTGSSGSGRGHSTVNTYINGTTNTFNFTGGGSKDPNDLSQWAYTSTSTPNKDTLNAGYAAAYNITDFDVIFGADRLSPNGDANIGIWFFQESVCTSGGAFVQCGTTTAAHHINGDVFIVSAFVTGGGASQIQAYEWDSACTSAVKNPGPGQCAAANLLVLPTAGIAFAITNNKTVNATWASYSNFSLVSPLFFEGGLDITQAFGGGNVPCFSSFLEETRSSQSPTAVLKDFLLGSFPVCHVSVTKTYTCNSFNADDTFNYTYTGTVTNDGGGALFSVTVKDSPTGSAAVTYTCGDLLKGQSKTFPGDCTSTGTNMVTTSTHPATNVADASAQTSSSGGTTITASTGSVTSVDLIVNGVNQCSPAPGIDVSKSCVTAFQATSTGNIEVRVDYTGSVTNTGNLNLISWAVSDKDSAGNTAGGPFNSTATLAPGASICYTNGVAACPSLTVATGVSTTTPTGAASYFPTGADALGLTLGRIQFTDTVSATGKASDGSNVGPVTKSASCVICPFGACPTS